jgi:hypothetical protein
VHPSSPSGGVTGVSLIFRYVPFPTKLPLWPLHGRSERPRPVILVSIIGPGGTATERGQLDPGADDTVFPENVAAAIGIDLTNAPAGTAAGVGQVRATQPYAEVLLRLIDGREYREWPARVRFTAAPLHRPLFSFAGFLQFFTATFYGDLEQVELTVNSSYPGIGPPGPTGRIGCRKAEQPDQTEIAHSPLQPHSTERRMSLFGFPVLSSRFSPLPVFSRPKTCPHGGQIWKNFRPAAQTALLPYIVFSRLVGSVFRAPLDQGAVIHSHDPYHERCG